MADAASGLWPLVILNTALFVLFAVSFFHPQGKRDRRVMGGHVWNDLIGWSGDPHLSPFHLATAGTFARVRHPQYDGLLLVMIGFLLQWPTIPTLLMFPVLVVVHTRLARAEEREVAARFGATWREYPEATPGFIPRRRPSRADGQSREILSRRAR